MLSYLVAAVGFQVALARPLPAPKVSIDSPPGQALEPGASVRVVWENVPPEVPECELLLVFGDGRTTLRVTEELSPGSGSYRWTVPNVSTRGARLVLRMERRGREVESPPSESFSIQASPDLEPVSLQWRDEEVWLTDGASEDLETKTSLPTGLMSPSRRVAPPPRESDPPIPPEGGGLDPGAEALRGQPSSTAVTRRPPPAARGNAPQFFPQRI